MTRLSIFFLTILMAFTSLSPAQQKQLKSVKWTIAANLPATAGQEKALGFAGPVVGVYQQVLVVAGGANFPRGMPWTGGRKKYYDDVYVYGKKNGKTVLYKRSCKLPAAIAYAADCSTPRGIFYAGGENEGGISNKAWLLQWDARTENIIVKNLPDLPIALTNAAAIAKGDRVYLAGGETTAEACGRFFLLNLDREAAGWKELPAIPEPVSHSVLAVQSDGAHDCIYLAGGRKKNASGISDLYASLYAFDLEKNQWIQKKPLPYSLCAGTGIAVGAKYILLFGGDRGATFHKTEMLIAAINTEKDDVKKHELIQQKNQLQVSHPGFSRELLLYNTVTDEWNSIGSIPFEVPVTTTACWWGNGVVIPGGEIKAGVRTPQVLLGKILIK
jgi:cyclically-permuted mutarotase family protein